MLIPIDASELADNVATCIISSGVEHVEDREPNLSITLAVALSIPLFKSIGFIPAATSFIPSLTIACVNTVAVVVPSPARSAVLLAASNTIKAPVFSKGSFSNTSLATVTPSLVTTGNL